MMELVKNSPGVTQLKTRANVLLDFDALVAGIEKFTEFDSSHYISHAMVERLMQAVEVLRKRFQEVT